MRRAAVWRWQAPSDARYVAAGGCCLRAVQGGIGAAAATSAAASTIPAAADAATAAASLAAIYKSDRARAWKNATIARRRLTRAHHQREFNDCIRTGRKARPLPRNLPVSLTHPEDEAKIPIHLAEWPSAFNGYLSRLHMSASRLDAATRLGALVRHLSEGSEGFRTYSVSVSVFNDASFDRAYEKVSSGKSSGPDGVPCECWGQGGSRLKETFLSLCRARFCSAASVLAERVEAVLADPRFDQSRPAEKNYRQRSRM